GEEIAPSAVIAMPAIAAVPADAHPLAGLPVGNAGTDRINHPRYLMTGNPWKLNPRKKALLGERIAVADATSKNFDPDRSRGRCGDRPLNDFERTFGARDLGDTHGSHVSPPTVSRRRGLNCSHLFRNRMLRSATSDHLATVLSESFSISFMRSRSSVDKPLME